MESLAGTYQFPILNPFRNTGFAALQEESNDSSSQRLLWLSRTQHVSSFIGQGYLHIALLGASVIVFLLRGSLHYGRRRWQKQQKIEADESTSCLQFYTPLPYILAQSALILASLLVSIIATFAGSASWAHSLLFAYTTILAVLRYTCNPKSQGYVYCHITSITLAATLLSALQSLLPLAVIGSTYRPDSIEISSFVCLALASWIPLVSPNPQRFPVSGKQGQEEDQSSIEKASSEETCSIISFYWTYGWITYLIFRATRKELVIEDLPGLPTYDAPVKWAKSIRKQRQRGGKTFFMLCRVLSKDIQAIIRWSAFTAFSEFLSPVGLVNLLKYLQSPSDAVFHPALWITLLFVGPITRSLCFHRYIFLATRVLVRIHMSLVQEIYYTATRSHIYDSSISEKNVDRNLDSSIGKEPAKNRQADITTLMSSDVDAIYSAREIFFVPIVSTITVIVSVAFLYSLLGWPSLVGVITLFMFSPLPTLTSRRVSQIQKSVMQATDARISKITEYLGSIRTLKYFGWEPAMEKQINSRREVEQDRIWKRNLMAAVIFLSGDVLPMMSLLATFSTVALFTDTPLDAPKAFTALSIMEILRWQCVMVSNIVRNASQAIESLRRVDRFFDSAVEIKRHPQGLPEFRNATFLRSPVATFRLQNISVSFVENALNVVTGPTGCGKTSLLLSLLGETILESGSATCPRDVAYVPQTAWLQNDSLRANVLFYSPFDQNRYDAVIQACGLVPDLGQLPEGDLTVIGERGTTLSGGQKQRVSLARAIYSQASTLLLDDVFSALDIHTTASVYDRCFRRGLLAGRTVILVTHLLPALQDARMVVNMEQGTVVSTELREEETLASSSASTLSTDLAVNGLNLPPDFEIENSKVTQPNGTETEDASLDKKERLSSRLVAEQSSTGRIPRALVLEYLLNFGGYPFVVGGVISTFVVQIAYFSITYWLSIWADAYENRTVGDIDVVFYLSVYAVAILSYLFFQLCNLVLFQAGGWRAAKKMHSKLLHAILYAPVSWFDQNPIGRAINRFGNDTRSLDAVLPDYVSRVVDTCLRFLMRIASIAFVLPIFAVPACIICCIGIIIGELYTRTQIAVRRLCSVNASPIFIHFTDSVSGMSVIRARSGMDERFQGLLAEKVAVYARAMEAQFNSNRWVSVRSDICAAMVTTVAGILAYTSNGDPGLVGFSLSNAVALGQAILGLVRSLNELEVELNTFQRVKEYAGIAPEEADSDDLQSRQLPPAHWPSSGQVEFHNVTARYHTGPEVLQDVSFIARPGERIGIVGRTGSGKSTTGLSLLRFTELVSGSITIDGVDVTTIPLNRLRTSVALIPQDPVLFSGTVQSNLDPFGELDETELQAALSACSTSIFSNSSGEEESNNTDVATTNGGLRLETPVAVNGENFSQGQRQVLGLARAISRRAKIVLLDEATASVDQETDEHIQKLIRSEFADSTIIAIAHRLRTIVDYDKVLVMGGGKVLETGTPAELIARNGVFCDMLRNTGEYADLVRIVEQKK